MTQVTPPIKRLFDLAFGIWRDPADGKQLGIAVFYGLLCHVIFALAVVSMIVAMFFGLSESFGRVPAPVSYLCNALLVAQFPLAHSVLLSARGRRFLEVLAPKPYGKSLGTTTYAIIASLQLLALFTLWTPTGVIWWQADGLAFVVICVLYSLSWLLLIKASYDAGPEVQSGALGWMSVAQNVKPVFPDMPTRGLFRFIRQPIYVAFALTLWTVPVWTPDQLFLAVSFTAYCLLAPRLKERRFQKIYGDRFAAYRARVPYVLPNFKRRF